MKRAWLGCFGVLGASVVLAQPARSERSEVPEGRQPEAQADQGLPSQEADCRRAEDFGGTELERAAFCASRKDAFASARTLANQALAADPDSFRARFVLGRALHLGEGNLPKALHHLERAEAQFLARHPGRLEPGSPDWFAGRALTWELMDVHGEMDHHEDRILYADQLGTRFGLDYAASKAWPLMKLGRFDEARALVEAALGSDDPWNRNVARTSLCAIESELRRREPAYEACAAAADAYQDEPHRGAVELTNAGSAAEETLRFDEAERRYLAAAERPPDTTVNPWMRLLTLYTQQGRFSEAVQALMRMDAYRASRPHPHLDQQDAAEADTARAALALALGFPDVAAELTRAVVERPDRQGTSSAASDQNAAGGAVFARTAYLAHARWLEARAAVVGFTGGWQDRLRALELRFDAWMVGRRALETLARAERLEATLRPEVPGSLEMPTWLDPEVVDIVGAGVAAVALRRARRTETLPADRVAPVFDAYAAEVAWKAGDETEALQRGLSASKRGDRGFRLLSARAAARAGQAALSLGRRAEAEEALQAAFVDDPSVLPRLGIRFPALITGDDVLGREVAERLRASPWFSEETGLFRLRVSAEGAQLVASAGNVLTYVQVDAPLEGEDPAAALADLLQRKLFMPRVDLAQGRIGSLAGGTGAGDRPTEKLRELLRGKKP